MEIRKYECPQCGNKFFVDCDDADYPEHCPFCGEREAKFIRADDTLKIAE